MRTMPNTAFWQRLQLDGGKLTVVIDLETQAQNYHWSFTNQRLMVTLSGTLTAYDPFPGQSDGGFEESSDMGVSVAGFKMVNTGDLLRAMLESDDLAMATIKLGRVFVDTPDLGRMEVYHGRLGDYSYNRNIVSGQARNKWNSLNGKWPYYTYNDRCAWRFGSAGCGFDTTSITTNVTTAQVSVASCTTLILATTAIGAYANGRFDFGRLTVTNGVNSGHVRTIRVHSGAFLALSHPLPVNSFTNMAFSIYPGCRKRLLEDCRSLYNNEENFLGFPYIPIQEQV